METVVLLVVAALLPTGVAYGIVGARWLHARYEAHRPPVSSVRPIEQVIADLRRLHNQLDETENAPSNVPAKFQRCRAARAAYLDALTAACTQLQVPAPAGEPVPRAEIYRVEADLRRIGLDVRPVG